jgi:PAS domain S-box-containing protein
MDVLHDILDNLSDGVIVIDPVGHIILYNKEALRIQRSVSQKNLEIGESFVAFQSDERKRILSDVLKRLKRQKKTVKNFGEYKCPFGASVFLEMTFVPVLGRKRELKYVNIITHDITSRKIFEKKVRAVTADVNSLIQNAHAFILSVDTQGYIVDWNDHCAQLTGYLKEEVLSHKVSDLLVAEENADIFRQLMRKILKNEVVGNFELPIRGKNGCELTLMLSASPRANANGKVIGATIVGQDITELTAYRRSLENQVRNKTAALEQVLLKEKEVVEMKSRFVSIASHEFRSPLSSIDFAASFIKQNAGTIGRKKLNEKVEVIEKHVNYMSHLLEDVLTYSKNETQTIRVVPTKVCLESFIVDAVKEVACHCKNSHHICVSSNELGTLLTDEKLLRNIVINLLTNAVKFSPGRDEVTINVLDKGAFISIEVRDEGIGIPATEIDNIFEPFFRGKAADAIQGTGLGLSIVKKAVELLQGSVKVESRPGKGTVFKVTIPRQMAFM